MEHIGSTGETARFAYLKSSGKHTLFLCGETGTGVMKL